MIQAPVPTAQKGTGGGEGERRGEEEGGTGETGTAWASWTRA